jgi:chromate transporter
MIPYVRERAVGQKKWLDGESLQEGVALCPTIPGATVMQMAAYIGVKVRGVGGAVISYIGYIFQALVLMLGLSFAYSRTHELPAGVSVFSGLQAVIVAVVANATWSFESTSLKSWKKWLIALVAAALFWHIVTPGLIIILAALLGMLLNGRQSAARGTSHSEKPHIGIPLLLFLLISAGGAFSALLWACCLP